MKIGLKLRNEKEDQFVYELFVNYKIKELGAEGWPDQMKHQICKMQFDAFEISLKNEYVDIEDFIIIYNSDNVGRIIISESEKEIIIVYFVVNKNFQGKGIGKQVLKEIISRSNNKKKELWLHVSKNNPAKVLYEKFGFIVIEEDEINYKMVYRTAKNI